MQLLDEMCERQPRPVRLIGVSIGSLSDIETPRQMSLFDQAENEANQHRVDQVVDTLSDLLGKNAVYRATSHDWINRKG